MKKFIQTIFLLALSLSVFAQDAQLDKANQHYIAGEYDQAIEAYNEILNGSKESAEVYYNLGNAYYKTGKYTQSILNYERAKLLAPNDEDIQFNLELANQHVVDAIDPLPQVFFVRWWNNITNKFSIDQWARISVVSFIVFLILAGLFFFTQNGVIKRVSFWTGILVIVISIFSFNFAARHKKRITEHNFAIITQPSVTVKSSPSDSGTDLFLIHEGLKVEIKDNLSGWMEIRLSDGNQGWLPANSVERI
ncbi:tetratricopeptide repeat protein [Mangrovibacterium diazotrophicum]|uniref:TPR repeat protein n=1 Tax=Mangrovibacterium diazotrophicum TaxID=1261403 RepID=A0A419W576_9BACT|nr:tetratricopeptide repeat protein [Mangrovibacterium diazotrophicum]RKD90595.1 TPR repeat protein [Mangrovibacterium diazotrophicum]